MDGQYDWHRSIRSRKRTVRYRITAAAASVCAAVGIAVGTTAAWLQTASDPLLNVLMPARVDCRVDECFDGSVKRDVNVTNTGSTPAYIRVKLISYRVNGADERIGGSAPVAAFPLGKDWFAQGNCYYYKYPVEPGKQPESPLIGAEGIPLAFYTDPDGGRQVIEVAAEAIQAQGLTASGIAAVADAWGIDPQQIREGGLC